MLDNRLQTLLTLCGTCIPKTAQKLNMTQSAVS